MLIAFIGTPGFSNPSIKGGGGLTRYYSGFICFNTMYGLVDLKIQFTEMTYDPSHYV